MNNNIKHLENGDFEVVSLEEATAPNWHKEAFNFEKALLRRVKTIEDIQLHAGTGGGKIRCR